MAPSRKAQTEAQAVTAELIQSISSADRDDRRRVRTRALNQLKKVIFPTLSREDGLELLASSDIDAGNGNCPSNNIFPANIDVGQESIVPTLLFIIGDDDDLSTEGQRETSVELLKWLFRQAFGAGDDAIDDGRESLQKYQMQTILIDSFRRCSQTFHKRMARCQAASNKGGFVRHHGIVAEPVESSEHVRLLLVELMSDLVGYCLNSCRLDETSNKIIIEATSNICGTLAKSTLLDPCPEVQRAACGLVELLSSLCPLGVRMNACRLFLPLTGRDDSSVGGSEMMPAFESISKKCLFQHRHAKTRCKSVGASAAVFLCFSNEDSNASDGVPLDTLAAAASNHYSGHGGQSSRMEQLLHSILLPGWGHLLQMDSSASVQITVLESLGNVASALNWGYSRNSTTSNISNMDLPFMVEARVLSLLLMGMSAGNAAQVRSAAVQKLCDLQIINTRSENAKCQLNLWGTLFTYFPSLLELILGACSLNWAPCQSKVRSLEALQVLFSLAIPLMEGRYPVSSASSESSLSSLPKVQLANSMVQSIMAILSKNILSEEKEVLEAAQACCHILGINNLASKGVLDITSVQPRHDRDALVTCDADSVEDLQSSLSQSVTNESSPRQNASILLILDGMMKGSLCNKSATSILHEIDPDMSIPTPNWFHSLASATAISSVLCHSAVTNNVAANSSLAWALLYACGSFVQCAQLPMGGNGKLELSEEVIIDILISITFLLGCPDEYGLSSHVAGILDAFSSSHGPATSDSNSMWNDSFFRQPIGLMDIHFRAVLLRITSSAPLFPWRKADPPFLAICALLRACSGSTVGRNFDIVAPFFKNHLTPTTYCKKDDDCGGAHNQCLRGLGAKDDLDEEYSLRISLMALLQTILSDESFSQTLIPGRRETKLAGSTFTFQFTMDLLLSLVLPNLVWKAGGMALALRKLAAATLFSLLSHYRCHYMNKMVHQEQNEGKAVTVLHPDAVTHLIPILTSNLEDTESTTRELSCICLSLVLEQISARTFHAVWETNARAIDAICPCLLELLDDNHDPVRTAACKTLGEYLTLAHSTDMSSSFNLELSSLENITSSLLIQLDDPDHQIQENVFQVLMLIAKLHRCRCEKNKEVVEMLEHHIHMALKSHRDGSYCRSLLEHVQKCHRKEHEKSAGV